MTPPEPPVDELVEQAEQRRGASAQLRETIAGITGTATDPDGLVRVTVTASGQLRALALEPAATGLGERLGPLIVRTAHRAAEDARQRCLNRLALVLGDELTMDLEDVVGVAPARTAGWDTVPTVRPGTSPAPAPEPAPDEEDVFAFDPSSLRSDR